MAVVESLQGLFEVVSSNWLAEWARVSNEIEKFAATCEVKDNVINILVAAWLSVHALLELDLVEDVRVLQLFHDLNLLEYQL